MSRIRPMRLSRREALLREHGRAHALGGAGNAVIREIDTGRWDIDEGPDAADDIARVLLETATTIQRQTLSRFRQRGAR